VTGNSLKVIKCSLVTPGTAAISRHSNTTGTSIVATELDGKRQEILMELVPGVRHIAVLADPNSPHVIPVMREATEARGIELSVYWVGRPDEIGPAMESAVYAGAKALNVLASPMLYDNRESLAP
jgi:putative ABC transport system substrate-binding protein